MHFPRHIALFDILTMLDASSQYKLVTLPSGALQVDYLGKGLPWAAWTAIGRTYSGLVSLDVFARRIIFTASR